jgi:secondary thiamine-phosphate synthase enzyme
VVLTKAIQQFSAHITRQANYIKSHMSRLKVITHKKREVIDITEKVQEQLHGDGAQQNGVCHLLVLHTTAALTTADLDPGTDLDMLDAFEAMMPKLRYRHPHDPSHVPDHILSALIGTSVSLIVEGGALVLGTWQRVVLIELDGPRRREIAMAFCGAE